MNNFWPPFLCNMPRPPQFISLAHDQITAAKIRFRIFAQGIQPESIKKINNLSPTVKKRLNRMNRRPWKSDELMRHVLPWRWCSPGPGTSWCCAAWLWSDTLFSPAPSACTQWVKHVSAALVPTKGDQLVSTHWKTRPLTEHVNTAAAALFGHVRIDEARGHAGLTPSAIRHK